jgi:acyl carrier protein
MSPRARILGRLTSSRLVSSAPTLWPVCYIPPGKLAVCFDDLWMHNSYRSDDRRAGTTRATLRSGFHGPLPVLYRFGGLIMTIASLKWSQKATATREVLASNDVRTLIAYQLGVDVKRVTDEAHFTDDLGADRLDRLELMIVIEDRFADVLITDEDVDQLEVVGDLIRHIENVDHERRRRSIVEATPLQ